LTPPLGQLNATGLAAKITLKPGNANLTPLGQPYASRFPAKIPPKPGNANLTPLGQFSGPRLPPNFGQQRDFPPPIIADKQNPPVSFELTLVISSQHCLLKWKLPEGLPNKLQYFILELVLNRTSGGQPAGGDYGRRQAKRCSGAGQREAIPAESDRRRPIPGQRPELRYQRPAAGSGLQAVSRKSKQSSENEFKKE
jgi:hypothetical protein